MATSRISTSGKRLFSRYIEDLPPGELCWIGVRPARKAPMIELNTVQAITGSGLEGDHRTENTLGSGRQVTLISEEYIGQIAHFLALSRGPEAAFGNLLNCCYLKLFVVSFTSHSDLFC